MVLLAVLPAPLGLRSLLITRANSRVWLVTDLILSVLLPGRNRTSPDSGPPLTLTSGNQNLPMILFQPYHHDHVWAFREAEMTLWQAICQLVLLSGAGFACIPNVCWTIPTRLPMNLTLQLYLGPSRLLHLSTARR